MIHLIYLDMNYVHNTLALNFHTGIIIGIVSIAWSAHLVHLAIPGARLMLNVIYVDHFTLTTTSALYVNNKDENIFSHPAHSGSSTITFFGGLKSNTISLYLTDIAHHHLGVGILFVLSSHFLLVSVSVLEGAKRRWQAYLIINCTVLAVITSVLAPQISLVTPYVYLCYDYITISALYVHHEYIGSTLMMGSMAHAAISTSGFPKNRIRFENINKMKGDFTSHLSWICLYVGFHTLGVYIHNDTILAFGEFGSQILIEPRRLSQLLPLGPGDLLFHHAIGVGLHVSILILLKGSLDAAGSKLIPDKLRFALSFACDGPIRGGTCDISAFDSNYLGLFWMLNTRGWITFYFHWKHLQLSEYNTITIDQSGTYLNGWFGDYLFFNSTTLMNGYNRFGPNDLSIVSWGFLYAHLCWATGFMFLISWRGYWQELMDMILVMHLKTPMTYNLWIGDIYTPLALSILQARFVGVVHFSTGFILTYAAFIIGATS